MGTHPIFESDFDCLTELNLTQKDSEKLREEANKLANSGGGFFSKIFGGNKLDEACEKYTQAGSRFKIDQKWSSAGECYETAANIQLNKLENKHESAQNFVEVGNCFRKSG